MVEVAITSSRANKMSKVQFKNFIGQSYKDDSPQLATSELINWFVEALDPDEAKSPVVLRPTPGQLEFVELSATGAIRGMYYDSLSQWFAVRGNQIFLISQDGTYVYKGSLNTINGPVKFADNGFQLIVIDGTYGYIYTYADGTFQQITSPNFPACDSVVYQDSFFIVNETGTNRVHTSNSLDGLTWDLNYGSAEGSADNVTSIISNNREIWVFGPQSYEVWYNSGEYPFPYTRVPGTFTSIGLLANNSLAEVNDDIFFLGAQDGYGMIFKSNGYKVQRISTTPIEREIANYATPDDAIASVYLQDGHYFYCLSFQGGDTTWVYDVMTGKWHKRTSYNTTTNQEERWRALYITFAYNKIYCADYTGGVISEISTNYYDDNGAPIVRTRIAPHLTEGFNRIIYNSFQLDCQVGVGLGSVTSASTGYDPQAYLSFSDDGGMTYGNEIAVSIGRVGEYKTQVKWNRLGSSRDRVFKVKISAPIKTVLIGAWLDIQTCLHG